MKDYSDIVAAVTDCREPRVPAISVVIVAWRRPDLLRECLDSLRRQEDRDFEVVIAHNGGAFEDDGWQNDLSGVRVDLRDNYRQIIARNVGATFARAPLLYFLDDDTIVDPATLANVRSLFDTTAVVAARGRMLFRSRTIFNTIATHYDLGQERLAGHLHESGLAMRSEVYRRFGGYDEGLGVGNECLFWLYHVGSNYGLDKVVYEPDAVIRTDYATRLSHYLWKSWKYVQSREHIRKHYAEIDRYFEDEVRTRGDKPNVPWRQWTAAERSLARMAGCAEWLGRHYHALRHG
jgi:glycosyltransferase involved in cell wall biosynthesis